ncbi:hypothetical protein [Thermomonospora cellulosilytica]|uniref:Uncharacterized protein n=1 Tax=Thermomonospora cellulosilytica TaxID=1411118 RepID=A0A7W3RA38_9ACTN|nr:hypothetical protein [Thermomonospora cellulosilytica]MBA9005998.1 hypothetical protein [Thermomonospora cellulosilytica]
MTTFAGGRITVTRYICPWCIGTGRACDGQCVECGGTGLVDGPQLGVDLTCDGDPAEIEAVPLPVPPGVMRRACGDCAYRPGSPEADAGTVPAVEDGPFYCHHGMHRTSEGYQPVAWADDRPLGYLICAGWWALATGQSLPETPYRDPDHRKETPR